MTIRTKLTIAGTEYVDVKEIKVNKSLSESGQISEVSFSIPNIRGEHTEDFNIGDEIIVYANDDASPTTKIFTGIVEDINHSGVSVNESIEVRGRDYSARFLDLTVEPIVYTNTEISLIVKSILTNAEITDITTTNVDTTTKTLQRISFNHVSVFEALKQLAELSGFVFYVDVNKDLHFEQSQTINSGVTFDNTNITEIRFDNTRVGMANKVWVYGDRYLSGFKEIKMANGGSSFTLLSKPSNTTITYLGSTLRGGIYEMSIGAVSGTDFLVNYNDKQIIFQSGTDIGYNSIPTSGGSFIAEYQRELPIVKYAQDDTSIRLYGAKTLIIRDKSIRDPTTALDIVRKKIEDADPLARVECRLNGWFSFDVGNTVNLNYSNYDITNEEMSVISVNYTFNPDTIQSEDIIDINLSKKVYDITDAIRDLNRRLESLESADIQDSDIITRLLSVNASATIIGSRWNVYTRNVSGNYLILDSPVFGILGSATNQKKLMGSPFPFSFILFESGCNDYSVTGSYDTGETEERSWRTIFG